MPESSSAFAIGLGYLWVIWDKKKQAWHDKLASTVVVKSGAKPQTGMAFLLVFLSLTAMVIIGALAFNKVFSLGKLEIEKAKKGTYTKESITNATEKMDPQAKVHYDRSQELFKQMWANGTDAKKVTALNDENITELKKALEYDPENARIWLELGSAYTWLSSEGTLEDGLAAFQKAEELDPDNIVYINNVADMLIRLDRNEDAILKLQQTMRITDNSGYANLSLGQAYKNLGIKDKSKEHFQRSIEIFTKENDDDGSFDDEILQAQKGIAELSK